MVTFKRWLLTGLNLAVIAQSKKNQKFTSCKGAWKRLSTKNITICCLHVISALAYRLHWFVCDHCKSLWSCLIQPAFIASSLSFDSRENPDSSCLTSSTTRQRSSSRCTTTRRLHKISKTAQLWFMDPGHWQVPQRTSRTLNCRNRTYSFYDCHRHVILIVINGICVEIFDQNERLIFDDFGHSAVIISTWSIWIYLDNDEWQQFQKWCFVFLDCKSWHVRL